MTVFPWNDYLTFAEELCQREHDAAANRSAASRAYYGVYHLIKTKLRNAMPAADFADNSRKTTAHQSIIHILADSGDDLALRLGLDEETLPFAVAQLRGLRDARNDADYEIAIACSSVAAQRKVAQARELLALFTEERED